MEGVYLEGREGLECAYARVDLAMLVPELAHSLVCLCCTYDLLSCLSLWLRLGGVLCVCLCVCLCLCLCLHCDSARAGACDLAVFVLCMCLC